MHPVGFEPTISAGERPQTYALDRAATGTGCKNSYFVQFPKDWKLPWLRTRKETVYPDWKELGWGKWTLLAQGAIILKIRLAREFRESGKKCHFKILNSQSTVPDTLWTCTKINRTTQRKNFYRIITPIYLQVANTSNGINVRTKWTLDS